MDPMFSLVHLQRSHRLLHVEKRVNSFSVLSGPTFSSLAFSIFRLLPLISHHLSPFLSPLSHLLIPSPHPSFSHLKSHLFLVAQLSVLTSFLSFPHFLLSSPFFLFLLLFIYLTCFLFSIVIASRLIQEKRVYTLDNLQLYLLGPICAIP